MPTGINRGLSLEGDMICAFVSIAGEGPNGFDKEYKGCVPFDDAFKALTNAQKRAVLIQAVRDARTAELATLKQLDPILPLTVNI